MEANCRETIIVTIGFCETCICPLVWELSRLACPVSFLHVKRQKAPIHYWSRIQEDWKYHHMSISEHILNYT